MTELTQVHHGADLAAEVWRARTSDGRQFAVKWSGAGTDAGHRAAAFLSASGIPGIPSPARTASGDLFRYYEGKRLTVTQWIDGSRAADSGLTLDQWTEYGALLARVHAAEPPAVLRDGLPRHSPVDARIPALVEELQQRLATQPPADDIEAELAAVWSEYRPKLITLAMTRPAEPTGPKVICHADPHLGNVLVGDSVQLIDWDDVVLAPREQDLMFMLGGMGDLGPTTSAQLTAFLTGYGDIAIDESAVRYYRHVRALEDVALWSQQALTGPDRRYALSVAQGILSHGLAALLS
ncbi:phosphotransferase [Kribbella sp. NPDC023855]|uniref:phosphotransferase enzyme family protein n=1 Tax=Kribbella sp. NPDC023855 TaxID=3154698 RepID=UPI0033D9AAD6